MPSGQSADGLFNVGNKQYFVESTGITEKLSSTTPIMESLETKAAKFDGAFGKDNTVVIKLDKGSNVPKQNIENQILYEYASRPERMKNVSRVNVYAAITIER